MAKYVITLCDGPTCMQKRSRELLATLESELTKCGLKEKVRVVLSGCLGMCDKGPVLIVNPGYVLYGNVTEADVQKIVSEHLLKGKPVAALVIDEDHLYNRFYRIFGDVNFFG
ncbi:MAG: (2Fe-2S) ferredoxin domain-containing protein, partial [Candidatus Omnitrophota bacterium]